MSKTDGIVASHFLYTLKQNGWSYIQKITRRKGLHGAHVTGKIIHRGFYTVARRYEFYFRVAKQYFTNERSE